MLLKVLPFPVHNVLAWDYASSHTCLDLTQSAISNWSMSFIIHKSTHFYVIYKLALEPTCISMEAEFYLKYSQGNIRWPFFWISGSVQSSCWETCYSMCQESLERWQQRLPQKMTILALPSPIRWSSQIVTLHDLLLWAIHSDNIPKSERAQICTIHGPYLRLTDPPSILHGHKK